MSDENQTPSSTPKTSAVPLKKETVRITLRARPGAGVTQPREATAPVSPSTGSVPTNTTSSIQPPTARRATAPIQLPSAPLPPAAPKPTTAPVTLPPAPMARPAGGPPAAPTAPRPAGGPPAAPRPVGGPPTAPRAAAPAAPKTETGAATAPLQKPVAPRPVPGSGTSPMAGGPTAALPKATVKLQQTQPMAKAPIAAPPSAPVKRQAAAESQQFYEEKDPDAGMTGISVFCLILGLVAMAVQLFGSERVMPAPADQPSAMMVPADVKVEWETKDVATGQWKNNFATKMLPDVPQ